MLCHSLRARRERELDVEILDLGLSGRIVHDGLPGAVLLKVGTFDDPSLFGAPQMVIYTIDKQSFHHVPDGVPVFERVPG